MFGRRPGPRRFPVWLRPPIGFLFFAVGILVLALEAGFLGGEVMQENRWVGWIAGIAFAAVGALLLASVFTGVDDLGNRPKAMRLETRIMLDVIGYVFGLGFAALFGAIGLFADWGNGAWFGQFAFCAIAAGMGISLLYALGRALVRAARRLPYDDGHGSNQ